MTSTVRWEDIVASVERRRREAGVPVRSAEQRVAALRRLEDEVRAARLAEIRKDEDLGLPALAEQLDLPLARLEAIERGSLSDVDLAALRAYVEALGGDLTVHAHFGDVSYRMA